MRFIRKAGAPADKSPKRLHVEPAELARKLVKEMDDHAVTRGDRVWVRNRYVIYLCPEDYENLAPRRARSSSPISRASWPSTCRTWATCCRASLTVEMVLDQDLELGYFGILAQRVYPQTARRGAGRAGLPAPAAPPAGPVPRQRLRQRRSATAASGRGDEHPGRTPRSSLPSRPKRLGLARRVIVITTGDQVQEFTQSRVVLGRSKEADLRIDDPNVSRKHAAIYWNNGRLDDRRPGIDQRDHGERLSGHQHGAAAQDVVAIGESRLTVESK